MAITNFLRKSLGDEAIAKVAYTMPAAVYLGLFRGSPGATGSLTDEVTGGSYARIEITSKLGAFNLTTGLAVSTADITFATPTANWGVVTHIGVMDAATVGNVMFYETMPSPRNIISGSRPIVFLAGQVQISLVA
jgi:hypothetical protein